MVRILCFEVNDERQQFVTEWAEKNDVQVDTVSYRLTQETVDQVAGYDGVSISEAGIVDSRLFPVLRSYGIKQLAQRTSGFEGIDLDAARAHGIMITNVSSYSPESIAEFTILLALQLLRKTKALTKQVEGCDFRWQPAVRGAVLKEMTIAVIGVGRIGFEAAKLFHAFGATVYGYATHRKEQAAGILTYKDSIEETIREADLVTLHIPGKEQNKHLFDRDMLQQMKKGAYLINTARGSLIDTAALLEVLDHEQLTGAALDVYEHEARYVPGQYKRKDIEDSLFQRLLTHPKVLYYPHCAYYTDVSMRNMVHYALDAVLEVIQQGDSVHRVN